MAETGSGPGAAALSASSSRGGLIDRALALGLSLLLAPVLLLLAVRAWWREGRCLSGETLIGRHRRPFRRWSFGGSGWGRELAVLFNLAAGDLAWVGPRPLTPAEAAALDPKFERRFELTPGLIYPYAVRRNVGIAYEQEAEVEQDFFFGPRPGSRLGLALRYLIGRLLAGGKPRPTPPHLHFFGVDLTNTTLEETLDWMVEQVRARRPALVAFVNPDCLNIAYRNGAYRKTLAHAARVLPDGIGIKLGCRILGVDLRENVNGTDLFPRLCERSAREGLRLFLLGARPGIAAAAAAAMQSRYPDLQIAGTRHGYFDAAETEAVVEEINRSGADILLVAFGAPRQELWLAGQGERLQPPLRLGVGGLFDFYSGRMPRAPLWMREIGLEWVFRLMQEPGRMWRRYLIGNPLFLYRVWHRHRGRTDHEQAA